MDFPSTHSLGFLSSKQGPWPWAGWLPISLPQHSLLSPAWGFLIVSLPLVLPIQEAFHLGWRRLLGSGRQGGSTLGREGTLGFAVRSGGGDGAGLLWARSLLCSAVDHFACVPRFRHLGTVERPFSGPREPRGHPQTLWLAHVAVYKCLAQIEAVQ